jgi:hypothetical protein
VRKTTWIAFQVPYTNATILATVSRGRLSGMIYDPLVNRPPDPWRHDCPHCQQDTSTRWPLKARKALRMLRLATVRRGAWEMGLAPNYSFRGRRGDDGWTGTVMCYNGKEIAIKQDPARPLAKIAGTRENLLHDDVTKDKSITSSMAARHLKMILLARVPQEAEIAACLRSLEAANQGVRKPTPCRKMKWT